MEVIIVSLSTLIFRTLFLGSCPILLYVPHKLLSGGIGQTALWCNFHDPHQRAGFLQMWFLIVFRSWFHLPALKPQDRILLQYRKGLSVSERGASVTSSWRLDLLDWCIPGNKDRFLLQTCILPLTQFF